MSDHHSTGWPNGLRVAFAGGNGFPPEAHGGVQSSTHDLAKRLRSVGALPSVFAPLYGDGAFGLSARTRLKLSRRNLVRDTGRGYPVFRAWFPEQAVDEFIAKVRPDVAVVQCHGTVPLATAFRRAGVPVVVYLRNVETDEMGGDPASLHGASFIANSAFTARTYRDLIGIDATVIPPTIERSLYQTDTSGEYVTFVNPVDEKGVDRAFEIAARCQDIPFLFVESWLLDAPALASLAERLHTHRNVRFERRTSDMRHIYGRTRIVLAPSKWAEAWGRIASEAHCSGIPVIGSTRGGLPEAIGPGGLTLDYDAPLDDWVSAVRSLWSDDARRADLSEAARRYSRRPELDGDGQFRLFLSVLDRALSAPVAA